MEGGGAKHNTQSQYMLCFPWTAFLLIIRAMVFTARFTLHLICLDSHLDLKCTCEISETSKAALIVRPQGSDTCTIASHQMKSAREAEQDAAAARVSECVKEKVWSPEPNEVSGSPRRSATCVAGPSGCVMRSVRTVSLRQPPCCIYHGH